MPFSIVRATALLLLILGITTLSAVMAPARAQEPLIDGPGKDWKNGPASCILTKEELKNFKSLKSDDERAKAIAQFWARRDPTPDTPRNEFKESFIIRVEHVIKWFSQGTAGWTTDEGRATLIIGYSDTSSRTEPGMTIWTYTRSFPPGAGKWGGKKMAVEVGFVKDDTGVTRMSPNGRMLIEAIQKLDPLEAAKLSMEHH